MRRPSALALAPLLALAGCATINRPLPPAASAFTRFHADVAPFDSAGECVAQPKTGDTRVVAAYFPTREDPHSIVTLVYDDNGRLRQAHEARGVFTVHFHGAAPSAKAVDSAVRATRESNRMTLVSLDYHTARASAENRGGGRDRQRVVGDLVDADTASSLGRPADRVRMAERRCVVTMQAQAGTRARTQGQR